MPDALAQPRMAAVSAGERGLRAFSRLTRLAVIFRAFEIYSAVALLRPLPSFGQRSISYVFPSSPIVRVWTSFALPQTSHVSVT